MESKAPSVCRLCNIALASSDVWRQHAKSDLQWVPPLCRTSDRRKLTSRSVYNLRLRVAEPGTIITPPSSSPRRRKQKDGDFLSPSDEEVSNGSFTESETEGTEPPADVRFNAEHCLFCSKESSGFDDNLIHMSKTHSFTIPRQEHLVVDLETVVGYLHLVIYGYKECILCASRRRTVEAIQHHMAAKGHCRFDIVADLEEFYNIPSHTYTADDESLRLPSGKLLNHPTKATGPSVSRTARSSGRRRMAVTTLPTSRSKRSCGTEISTGEGADNFASSDTQLSRLAKGDQQSLAHLQDYQLRSLVASGAKAIGESQREAKSAELRLSKAGNITMMGTFRADTSKRFRGPWG